MLYIKQCDVPELLPVARSLIKRIKNRTSLGSSRLETGLGLILVEVRPGAEFVWISGGADYIGMDSGVVDVLRYNGISATSFDAGILYLSDSTAPREAGFSASPGASYLTKKYGASAAGLYGSIKLASGELTGYLKAIAPSPAQSFSPYYKDVAGSPVFATDDDQLLTKKAIAVARPSSLFTGKTRLWIQAMYGAHLYRYGVNGGDIKPTDKQPEGTFRLSLSGVAIDGVVVPTADGKDGFIVGTNTGVILLADKTHVACTIRDGLALFCPLKATAFGAKLRAFMTGNNAASLLVETYILAGSTPDTKRMQSVALNTGPSVYSMGYGFHWNWSGTAADIVTHEDAQISAFEFGIKSTHRRFTPSVSISDGVMTCSASVSVVETSDIWSRPFYSSPILFPLWSSLGCQEFDRILPERYEAGQDSNVHNAPVYAFYVHDTLHLYRTSMTEFAGSDYVTFTPGYNILAGPVVYGLAGASYSARHIAAHSVFMYSAAAGGSVAFKAGYVETGADDSISGGTVGDLIPIATWVPQGGAITYGEVSYGSPASETRFFKDRDTELVDSPNAAYQLGYGGGGEVSITKQNNDRSFSESGTIKLMVMAWDSQAVMLAEGKVTSTHLSGITRFTGTVINRFETMAATISPEPDRRDLLFRRYNEADPLGGSGGITITDPVHSDPDEYENTDVFNNTYYGSAGSAPAGSLDSFSHYTKTEFDGKPPFSTVSGALGIGAPVGPPVARSGPLFFGNIGYVQEIEPTAHNAVFVGCI